ncbi:hypothetical protein SAMN05444280_1241 [Tangfeifania diversioriginum]|uniref:Uncharacterized protein n=1 Tax=Tangfeifania diversioriginum TaxID=1168035 RepID=A0A1M6KP05_9BACT|nr:hypothetical protein SAMN05444280_1241 [Tangfeifania diversioriginum]
MLYKSKIHADSFSKIINDEKKQSISYTFLTMPKYLQLLVLDIFFDF